jgi:hypothetical protein
VVCDRLADRPFIAGVPSDELPQDRDVLVYALLVAGDGIVPLRPSQTLPGGGAKVAAVAPAANRSQTGATSTQSEQRSVARTLSGLERLIQGDIFASPFGQPSWRRRSSRGRRPG